MNEHNASEGVSDPHREWALQKALAYANDIIATLHEPFVVLDGEIVTAGAAITVDRIKVITATTMLLRRPGRTPLEFKKNSNVAVDKGIKGNTPFG